MSEKTKIVVLGTEDSLKQSLISLILGKDVFAHRNTPMKIDTYENDTYKVIYTANFYTASEDIRNVFSSEQHPDMCLLVVKDDVSTEEVQQQIEKLHKITEKPKEEFRVLLPLSCKTRDDYPVSCSLSELFNKLAEYQQMMPTSKRSADQPPTQMETDKPLSPSAASVYRRYIKVFSTDPKKSSKGNHSDTKVNLVLLGMSGTGKSASGNTILGKSKFKSEASSMPVTTECQVAETEINGTCVRVIDTPDIFDDEIKSSVKNQHVTKCKQLCQSEPCVYLLVMQVGRFTDGERDILKKLEKAFGSKAKKQTVILFTRREELQRADMSFEDFLHSCQPELKNIVEQCGSRCVVFDNKAARQHQVEQLMETVNEMLNKQQKQ